MVTDKVSGFSTEFVQLILGRVKRIIIAVGCLLFLIAAWVVLEGPLKERFALAYQTARDFLLWFEDNMGSDIFSECFELEFEYLKNTVLMDLPEKQS